MTILRRAVPNAGLVLVGIAAATMLSACTHGEPATEPTTSAAAASTSIARTPAAPATVTVVVKDMKFDPAEVTIKVGQTVKWVFDDGGVPHTATGLRDFAAVINSPILKAGDYSHTFDRAGTYNYICTIHPEMTGSITVEQ